MFEPRLKSKGVLAQLVERFNGIEEVSGSTPLHSTFHRPSDIRARRLRARGLGLSHAIVTATVRTANGEEGTLVAAPPAI